VIDPQSGVFSALAAALREAHTGISVYPEEVETLSKFPAVVMQEIGNYEPITVRDLSNNENAAMVGFQTDIYSNKQTGKLKECQAIAATIDSALRSLGYSRTYYNMNMPNTSTQIKRGLVRYESLATN
jgi:hypothetical protein